MSIIGKPTWNKAVVIVASFAQCMGNSDHAYMCAKAWIVILTIGYLLYVGMAESILEEFERK